MEEEIRRQAICRHIADGESPKSIYTSLKRSKKWFFKWLKRYQTGDADWFKDQGRAPPAASDPDEPEAAGSHHCHPTASGD